MYSFIINIGCSLKEAAIKDDKDGDLTNSSIKRPIFSTLLEFKQSYIEANTVDKESENKTEFTDSEENSSKGTSDDDVTEDGDSQENNDADSIVKQNDEDLDFCKEEEEMQSDKNLVIKTEEGEFCDKYEVNKMKECKIEPIDKEQTSDNNLNLDNVSRVYKTEVNEDTETEDNNEIEGNHTEDSNTEDTETEYNRSETSENFENINKQDLTKVSSDSESTDSESDNESDPSDSDSRDSDSSDSESSDSDFSKHDSNDNHSSDCASNNSEIESSDQCSTECEISELSDLSDSSEDSPVKLKSHLYYQNRYKRNTFLVSLYNLEDKVHLVQPSPGQYIQKFEDIIDDFRKRNIILSTGSSSDIESIDDDRSDRAADYAQEDLDPEIENRDNEYYEDDNKTDIEENEEYDDDITPLPYRQHSSIIFSSDENSESVSNLSDDNQLSPNSLASSVHQQQIVFEDYLDEFGYTDSDEIDDLPEIKESSLVCDSPEPLKNQDDDASANSFDCDKEDKMDEVVERNIVNEEIDKQLQCNKDEESYFTCSNSTCSDEDDLEQSESDNEFQLDYSKLTSHSRKLRKTSAGEECSDKDDEDKSVASGNDSIGQDSDYSDDSDCSFDINSEVDIHLAEMFGPSLKLEDIEGPPRFIENGLLVDQIIEPNIGEDIPDDEVVDHTNVKITLKNNKHAYFYFSSEDKVLIVNSNDSDDKSSLPKKVVKDKRNKMNIRNGDGDADNSLVGNSPNHHDMDMSIDNSVDGDNNVNLDKSLTINEDNDGKIKDCIASEYMSVCSSSIVNDESLVDDNGDDDELEEFDMDDFELPKCLYNLNGRKLIDDEEALQCERELQSKLEEGNTLRLTLVDELQKIDKDCICEGCDYSEIDDIDDYSDQEAKKENQDDDKYVEDDDTYDYEKDDHGCDKVEDDDIEMDEPSEEDEPKTEINNEDIKMDIDINEQNIAIKIKKEPEDVITESKSNSSDYFDWLNDNVSSSSKETSDDDEQVKSTPSEPIICTNSLQAFSRMARTRLVQLHADVIDGGRWYKDHIASRIAAENSVNDDEEDDDDDDDDDDEGQLLVEYRNSLPSEDLAMKGFQMSNAYTQEYVMICVRAYEKTMREFWPLPEVDEPCKTIDDKFYNLSSEKQFDFIINTLLITKNKVIYIFM